MTRPDHQFLSKQDKTKPGMRRQKRKFQHGNPELTERILKAMPAEVDIIKAARLINDRAILDDAGAFHFL